MKPAIGILLLCLNLSSQEEQSKPFEKLLKPYSKLVQQADMGFVRQQIFINSKLIAVGKAPKYDFRLTQKALEIKVATGDAESMYLLAVLLGKENAGNRNNQERRMELLAESARLYQPEAMLDYSQLLSRNESTSAQAIDLWISGRELLTKRAESGDQQAMSRLWYWDPPSKIMHHPRIVSKSLERRGEIWIGEKWMRRSAREGDVDAMFQLGICLTESAPALEMGERKTLELEGIEWLEKGAELGHWESMARLGMVYWSGLSHQLGLGTFVPNLKKIWLWWDMAIAIVGEEKLAETVLLPGQKWPPRPGQEPPYPSPGDLHMRRKPNGSPALPIVQSEATSASHIRDRNAPFR